MPRSMKLEVLEDRVYRSNAPRNGKPSGVYYLVKTILPGNLATVSSYNPNATIRKFITRTIQLESLAGYALELVPLDQEPSCLRSIQGESVCNSAPPEKKKNIDVSHIDDDALDLMHEIDRCFNSNPEGERLFSQDLVLRFAAMSSDLAAMFIKTLTPVDEP